MIKDLSLQNAGLSSLLEPLSNSSQAPSIHSPRVLGDFFKSKKTCLCPGCCQKQDPIPAEKNTKDFKPVENTIDITIENKTFSFKASGELTDSQLQEVKASLAHFKNRLELLSQGKSHRNWVMQKVVDENPITFKFVRTADFKRFMANEGYSAEIIQKLEGKISGLYNGENGNVYIIVDSWQTPGQPVGIQETINHELIHALDDLCFTDSENESENGYLTSHFAKEMQDHWSQGFARAGLTGEPLAEIKQYFTAQKYLNENFPDTEKEEIIFTDYTVKKNDSLTKIAKKQKTSVDLILADNQEVIKDKDVIQPGQVLKIRAGLKKIKNPLWLDHLNKLTHFEINILKSFPRIYGATGFQPDAANGKFDRASPLREFLATSGETYLDPNSKKYYQEKDPVMSSALEVLLSDHDVEKTVEEFKAALLLPWPAYVEKPLQIHSLEELLNPPSEGTTHIVKEGDTLSEICLKYGYKLDEVVDYNHIKNPHKISIGQKIKFPAKHQ